MTDRSHHDAHHNDMILLKVRIDSLERELTGLRKENEWLMQDPPGLSPATRELLEENARLRRELTEKNARIETMTDALQRVEANTYDEGLRALASAALKEQLAQLQDPKRWGASVKDCVDPWVCCVHTPEMLSPP